MFNAIWKCLHDFRWLMWGVINDRFTLNDRQHWECQKTADYPLATACTHICSLTEVCHIYATYMHTAQRPSPHESPGSLTNDRKLESSVSNHLITAIVSGLAITVINASFYMFRCIFFAMRVTCLQMFICKIKYINILNSKKYKTF